MVGRSTFARLTITKYDPGAGLILGPLLDWARRLCDKLVTREELHDAWQEAKGSVGLASSSKMSRKVCGAPGATIQAVERIGWKFPAFETVITEDGLTLKLDEVSTSTLKLHGERGIHDAMARSSSWCAVLGGHS